MPSSVNHIEDLARQFLAIPRRALTGTLTVEATDGRRKHLLFQQGLLADMDTGREDTLLEAAVLDTGILSEKDIRRARKAQSKSSAPFGATLLDLGIVPEETVQQSIHARLTEEVSEVFGWEIEKIAFVEHEPDERLESFTSELGDYYEVLADPEETFIEAARRLERWDLVRENFSILRDVFYATPSSFQYFHEEDRYPNEHAILRTVDGIKDVGEVVAESGVDPFLAVQIIRQCKARGELELINPVQMFQLGVEFSNAGKFEKAAKLFQRAHDRGLDDFDLQFKLAQCFDALGKKEEAVQRFTEFGEKCIAQDRPEEAIKSFKRAVKLDPDHMVAQEKYLEVLLERNRVGEALEQGVVVAERKAAAGDPRAGLDLLLRLRSLNPKDAALQQKIIALAEASGDHATARAERDALARTTDQRKDVESEIETYQKRFCDGNDSLDVRLKLAELHLARGNRQKALDHISALLNMPDKYRVKDEATLVLLHEAVREMKPIDLRSNRWLAEHYNKKGEKEKSVAILTAWIAALEREGDLEEVIHIYERLLAIDDRNDHRWGLAMALEKLGRTSESRRELRSLANLAMRKKDFDQATKALDHILKAAPLDIETRKMQADLYEAKEDRDLVARKHEEIALLDIIAGNVLEAEQYCRRLPPGTAGIGELVRRLGMLCLEQGDQQKAVEQVLKAGKMHLEEKNLGLSRVALDQLLKIRPGHPEATTLLADLKTKEAPPPPPSAAPAPPQEARSAAPAAPVQAAPPPVAEKPSSPHLTFERAPFEPTAPITTKVSGMTAKLRRLKAGPEEGAGVKTIKSGVKNITAKLKNLKGADEPQVPGDAGATRAADAAGAEPSPSPAAGQEVESVAAGEPKTVPASALKSAASRLKALAEKKASTASAPAGAPTAEQNAAGDAGAETKKAALGNSASRLAALRKGKEAAAVTEPAPPAAEAAPTTGEEQAVVRIPLGDGPSPAPPEGAAGEPPGSAPVAATQKKKLGTSASKLAELRKKSVDVAAGV
jgi:tetratricopeptide (TPR) repeat protein